MATDLAHRLSRVPDVVVACVIAVVAAAWAWLRLPPGVRNEIWAEDGGEFLTGALSGVDPLSPYAGYLHVVPRLVAEAIVAVVPPGSWDLALTGAAVAVAGAVCGATYVLCGDLVSIGWVRVLMAFVPVLLPVAARETLGNLANLHTLLLWLAFWLLLHRPRSGGAAAGWAVVALLVGMTEIIAVLLLPLCVVGWRDRRRWPPRVALLVGLLAQVVTSLLSPRIGAETDAAWSVADLALGWAGHPAAGLWSDGDLTAELVLRFGDLGLLLLALPVVAGLVAALVWGERRHRWLAAGLAATSALVWSASVVANFSPALGFGQFDVERWAARGWWRYAASAGYFALALVLVALDATLVRGGRALTAIASAVGAALLLAAVAQARPELAAEPVPWPTDADLDRGCATAADGVVEVPIAPTVQPPTWFVVYPCDAGQDAR